MKEKCRHGSFFFLRCDLCEKEYAEICRRAAEQRAKNPSTSAPLVAARQEESHGTSEEEEP